MKKSNNLRVFFFLFCFFITLLPSCKNPNKEKAIDYTGFSDKKFILTGIEKKEYTQTDTLAEVSVKIPDRLDTFYQWHNYSDCLSCGRLQYRFSDSKFSQLAESGWLWDCMKDSVYQLTFIHNPIRETPDSIKIRGYTIADSGKYHHYDMLQSTFCSENDIQKKELVKINEQYYFIASFVSSCSKFHCGESFFVTAKTTLSNRYLYVIGECSIADSSGFLDMMYKTIHSIKIREK